MEETEDTGSGTRTPFNLGAYSGRVRASGLSVPEFIALCLTVLWLLGVTVFFFVADRNVVDVDPDPLRSVMLLLAIFMPIALIWVAALAANSARVMREEAQRLQSSIDAMRQTYLTQQQADRTGTQSKSERLMAQLSPVATGPLASAYASSDVGTQTPATAKPATQDEEQPSFAEVAPTVPSVTVSTPDFISALNFPETADDRAGFQALRRAMKDRRASELVQASQDVLTLLSQEGIYMDDLIPDRSRPEIWRRFAEGQRGRPIATLGGIRDRSSLALSAARMRQDPVFRDATHHFLRKFDHIFSEFASTATDAEIAALAETRTARAFMLLGRVAGVFT